MGDPDPQNGSPPVGSTDNQDGSMSDTPADPGGGSSPAPKETSRAEVEVVGRQKGGPLFKPSIVCDSKGRVVDLTVDTIKAVDSFVVPNGSRNEGARERSCLALTRSKPYGRM